jgi:preprotein translocase subunit SecG
MHTLIIIVHVVVALTLILIVLLQTGKGASVGAAFGGGSSGTVFGSRGPSTFLGKITALVAIVFMLTSLGLSIFGGTKIGGDSLMENAAVPVQEEPAQQPVTEPEIPADQAQPIPEDAE